MSPLDRPPSPRTDLDHLIAFGAEAVRALEQQGVHPIVYGSLAYMAHTRDASQGVHDIDFLVRAADRLRIGELLSGLQRLRVEPTTYHSTKIYRGNLVISFDEIERLLLVVTEFHTIRFTFAGQDFAMLDRASLEATYEAAAATTPRKLKTYVLKLRRLKEQNAV